MQIFWYLSILNDWKNYSLNRSILDGSEIRPTIVSPAPSRIRFHGIAVLVLSDTNTGPPRFSDPSCSLILGRAAIAFIGYRIFARWRGVGEKEARWAKGRVRNMLFALFIRPRSIGRFIMERGCSTAVITRRYRSLAGGNDGVRNSWRALDRIRKHGSARISGYNCSPSISIAQRFSSFVSTFRLKREGKIDSLF